MWAHDPAPPILTRSPSLASRLRTPLHLQESTLQRPFSAAPDFMASSRRGSSRAGRGPEGLSLPNMSTLDTDKTHEQLKNPEARSGVGGCGGPGCTQRPGCPPGAKVLTRLSCTSSACAQDQLNQRLLGKAIWVGVQPANQGAWQQLAEGVKRG